LFSSFVTADFTDKIGLRCSLSPLAAVFLNRIPAVYPAYFRIMGVGFFLLVPEVYKKAEEKRREQGKINSFFIAACGKYLLLGALFIYAFLFCLYRF
jgi:hypothetical protein